MLTVVFADQAGGVAPGTSPIPLPGPGTEPAVDPTLPAQAPGALTIEVAASGALRANGVAIAEADVGNLFRAAFARDKATSVILVTDPAASQAVVTRLADLAKSAGITKLAVSPRAATPPATTPPTTTPPTATPPNRGSAAGSAASPANVERSPIAPPSPDLVTPRGGAGSGSATPPPTPTPAPPPSPTPAAPAAGSATSPGSGSAAR